MPVTRHARSGGQALVEVALAVPVFLVLLLGLVDFGIAIYKYNAVSQAAREIARVTSVHPGDPLGSDPLIAPVVATQQTLVPGLSPPVFQCVTTSGAPVTGACDYSQHSVQVQVTAPYAPVSFFGLLGKWDMRGTSSVQIQ